MVEVVDVKMEGAVVVEGVKGRRQWWDGGKGGRKEQRILIT